MQPTINIHATDSEQLGDTILINRYSEISRNDIVVANVSWHENYIIKRVVGTPGDKIQIKDENNIYNLYVNDEILYSKNKTGQAQTFPKTGSVGYYDDYLKFLENPYNSEIVKEDESGKYIQLKENEYFLMGDNWGKTTDSITKGTVKLNELVGKVDLVIDLKNNPIITSIKYYLQKLFLFN